MDFMPSLFTGLAALLNLISKTEARQCEVPSSIPGQKKLEQCTQGQYCCSHGCCMGPTFQFYQLWYYWFMVIFMLIICSGGQWWYRYWINGRYLLGAASHNAALNSFGGPGRTVIGSTPHRLNPQLSSVPPSTRVLYRPSVHGHNSAIVLEPYWKPGRIAPPSYSPNVPPPKPYGPPPSYDSVVGLSELGRTTPPTPVEPCPQPLSPPTEGQASTNTDNSLPLHSHPSSPSHHVNTPSPHV